MVTVEELKAILDIAVDDPTQDSYLNRIIAASVTVMENYIGNKIEATDVTETLAGTGSRVIALTYYPVISLISARDIATDEELVDLLTVESDGLTGLVRYEENFFYPERYYRFSYRAGYETVPFDIEYAQLLLCQHLYYQADRVKGGVQSVVTPDGSYVYDTEALPSQVRQILDKYRKHYF